MKPSLHFFTISLLAFSQSAFAQLTPTFGGSFSNQVQMSIILDYGAMHNAETLYVNRLANASALVLRLREHSEAVSTFLWQSLSNEQQLLITNYQPLAPGSKEAEDACIKAMNRIIKGPCIYTPERFGGVALSDEATILVARSHLSMMHEAPSGAYWNHLNYLLLRDAYATELLSRCEAGENRITLGEAVLLTIAFTNISHNMSYWIVNSYPIEDDELYGFDVRTMSGKRLSPRGSVACRLATRLFIGCK